MLYKVQAVQKWENANRKLWKVPKKMKINPRSWHKQVSFFLPTNDDFFESYLSYLKCLVAKM